MGGRAGGPVAALGSNDAAGMRRGLCQVAQLQWPPCHPYPPNPLHHPSQPPVQSWTWCCSSRPWSTCHASPASWTCRAATPCSWAWAARVRCRGACTCMDASQHAYLRLIICRYARLVSSSRARFALPRPPPPCRQAEPGAPGRLHLRLRGVPDRGVLHLRRARVQGGEWGWLAAVQCRTGRSADDGTA